MQQEHLDSMTDIGTGGCMFREGRRHQGEMPGVLGGILTPGTIREQGVAYDVLELVDLYDEGDLPFPALG
jgi:hypothetical protein